MYKFSVAIPPYNSVIIESVSMDLGNQSILMKL